MLTLHGDVRGDDGGGKRRYVSDEREAVAVKDQATTGTDLLLPQTVRFGALAELVAADQLQPSELRGEDGKRHQDDEPEVDKLAAGPAADSVSGVGGSERQGRRPVPYGLISCRLI